MSPGELSELVTALGTHEDRRHFEQRGSTICPEAPRMRNDLHFRVTSASDCAIVSAKISPAGVINFVSHCWTACFELLSKGIMCRGYIKRGRIYHTDGHQYGTGLSDAVERERRISVFREDADERGTPFIEVDPDVVRYIDDQLDRCVKGMFSRMVKVDGEPRGDFPVPAAQSQLHDRWFRRHVRPLKGTGVRQ